MSKDVWLGFRVSAALDEALRQLADDRRRSATARALIREGLAIRGYWPPPQPDTDRELDQEGA